MASNDFKLLKIRWSIKGYVNFQIRPHVEIPMRCIDEESNKYDEFAMLVMFPDISEIPIHLHNDVTRERKGGRPEQRVKDIAAKPVGRVPANL